MKVETLAKGGSDHLLVLAIRNTRSTISRPSYVRKRIYRKFNPCEFIEAVQQTSWLDVYLCNDVDKAVTLMSDKIRFILDTMAPLKTIQVRTNYNPWLSEVTKDMIKQRNILHKRAIDSGDVQDWTDYKLIRNRVVSRQKYEGKTNQSKKLSEIGHNSANLWKNVKNILNWSKESSPGKLFVNGKMLTKSEEIASAQNSYFLEKVRRIRENMPISAVNPLDKLKKLMAQRTCLFELKPVHPDLVGKIIDSLKNSNSLGLDCIETKIIKLIKPEILPALTHIINLSISTKVFPSGWKQAKIIPLFKKGDHLDPKKLQTSSNFAHLLKNLRKSSVQPNY